MDRSDEIAIELSAERRRHEEQVRREEDARRAELPRALREDRREAARFWRTLARRVVRRLVGRW